MQNSVVDVAESSVIDTVLHVGKVSADASNYRHTLRVAVAALRTLPVEITAFVNQANLSRVAAFLAVVLATEVELTVHALLVHPLND